MSEHIEPGRVAVATDGTDAGTRGVRHAALEARRRGVQLQVIHAMSAYLPIGPVPTMSTGGFDESARFVLDRAVATAHEAAPEVHVVRSLARGTRVHAIVEAAEGAALLVLCSRPLHLADRIWTGATVTGVAARSSCPVLVLPTTPGPAEVHHRIGVAVKRPEDDVDLLRAAFAEAAESGSELVVHHAWRMQGAYDDIITSRTDRDSVNRAAARVIDETIAGLRADHPGVEVAVQVQHGQAARVLVDATGSCDRLLISRPHHGGYFHHLGATARALLREAHCPIEVRAHVESPESAAAVAHGSATR